MKFLVIDLIYDWMDPKILTAQECIQRFKPYYDSVLSRDYGDSTEKCHTFARNELRQIEDFVNNAQVGSYLTKPEIIICVKEDDENPIKNP